MMVRPNSRPATSRSFGEVSWRTRRWTMLAVSALLTVAHHAALAQAANASSNQAVTTEEKVQRLTAAVAQAQTQMEAYQRQLQDMQKQLSALQSQLAAEKGSVPTPSATPQSTTASGSSASYGSGNALED